LASAGFHLGAQRCLFGLEDLEEMLIWIGKWSLLQRS